MADAALEKGCVSLPSELLDKKVLNAHVMSQDAVYVGSSLVFEARLKKYNAQTDRCHSVHSVYVSKRVLCKAIMSNAPAM